MKFIDEVNISVKAGNGGSGKVSFLHTHLNPKSGPDGGNGGNGGDVYLFASNQFDSFYRISIGKRFVAGSGGNGGNNLSTGKKGSNLLIGVPLGTLVYLKKEHDRRITLGELTTEGARMMVAKGGKGGKGNAFFRSSVNRTPRFAQKGYETSLTNLILELRTIADVGLVGFPNAGKSTLINSLTNSRSRIGDFEFTTLSPQLGVLSSKKDSANRPIIIADLPGIVENAANNKGLGLKFLRHISRCNLLIYVLDCSKREDDFLKDYRLLSNELFSSKITNFKEKEFIVVWTKIDLVSEQMLTRVKDYVSQKLDVVNFFVSSLEGSNISKLKHFISTRFATKVTEIQHDLPRSLQEVENNYALYDFTDDDLDLEIKNVGGFRWKIKSSYLQKIFDQESEHNYQKLLTKFFDNQKVKEKIEKSGVDLKKNYLLINGKSYSWKR